MSSFNSNYPKYYDLTTSSEEKESEPEELTHLDKAILRYFWTIPEEVRSKLTTQFTLQSYGHNLYSSLKEDDKHFLCLYLLTGRRYRVNWLSINKGLLNENLGSHYLISIRVNRISKFYECLIRKSFDNFSDAEMEGIGWL